MFVLVGTTLQFIVAMYDLSRNEEAAVEHQIAVADLLAEVSWWRPIKRRRHVRDVMDATTIDGTSPLPGDIRKVKWTMASWALLTAAAFLAFVQALLA